ncbi:DUF3324 domain-containing protein [Periweissella cryptocerci]|uniref:DUF3324 domain-containing protein n=1 Tax=Periweissella cryptocerci TaxID=2506420 RepID=A0A4P6YUJ5_9LACO|nr:DUF916 and DUF3324 domain-containing protein [Periweissella cryptocerci]QBO36383.1 DUF3324 domain-containing protein [Periweissella cryptocerci]
MKKLFASIIATLGMFTLMTTTVSANQFNFAVEPQLPKNQINKKHSYFDLKVAPNQKQTLEVKLKNDTDKPVVVEAQINTAKTNSNGVVEYNSDKLKLDKSLPVAIKDILTAPETITIPAKSAKNLNLALKMPAKQFKGVLAGGITFKEVSTTKEAAKKKGVSIVNKYAYVVGVVLREENTPVAATMTMPKAYAGQVNFRNNIIAELHNTSAKYINQVEVTSKIYKKNGTKALYSNKKNQLQMAPNAIMDYPTSLGGQRLQAGKYTIKVDVKAGTDEWHFAEDFEITRREARSLNEQDVTVTEDNTWWFVAAGVVLLVGVIGLIYYRLRKKDKENKALRAQLEETGK